MKLFLIISVTVLLGLKANAQDKIVEFENLPQNVKSIIANDLFQYTSTIEGRVNNWLRNGAYTDDTKHLILKGRADTYAYYVYYINSGLIIEAIEKYAGGATAASIGDIIYSTTVLYRCTNHRPSHSTSSVSGEADLKKKYHCTDFSFQAL